MKGPIVGLLLAGGQACRFGSDKLMHPLPGGEPIAVRSLRSLIDSGVDHCLAVVPPGRAVLGQALQATGADLHVCYACSQGMGHTLACGVQATLQASGWLIALADMPFVKSQTITRVGQRLRAGAAIAVPRYQSQRGHPVGFSERFAKALAALEGDRGAREVLRLNAACIDWVDVDDPGILLDVDTPADLEAALHA